jgi:two-component system CheB/CheR fusion protein
MNKQSPDSSPEFEALLNHIKRTRGFDFTGYKRTSLLRRFQKRMQMLDIDSYSAYTDYLEVHPDEFALLFDTILINVTSFFRDPAAWEYLATDILPLIFADKQPNGVIRVWVAGCASGEDAYTIAILLAEAMGVDAFRDRVKIYASDVDEHALNQARQATYSDRDIGGIPPPLREKYFESADHRYVFRKDLRRCVIFGRHDLVQDAPISRIDLLICRNVLMYFNAEAQSRILSRFHFALNDRGFLFLGKAEMLFTHANLFTPVDLKRRVFLKVPRASLRDRLLVLAQTGDEEASSQLSKHVRFREAAFDASIAAQIVIDLNGFLILANERARNLLGVSVKDSGRTLQELAFSYQMPELRLRIEEVFVNRKPGMLRDIDWPSTAGDLHILEVQVVPLLDSHLALLGASVTFNDVTRYKRLQIEIEHANQELETAYEELQSTNEELETTNEELQSTVEELETTNEELQSTNEELETMNEELQSTNEELHTINDEIRRRTDELNQANAFLESVLTSLRGAVVVVDKNLSVQVWNPKAEDLWGLRENEAEGKNFLNLDIGLPVEQLRQPIRDCLSDGTNAQEYILEATNRRGKPIRCKVSCTPLHSSDRGDIRGVILVMEELDGNAPKGIQG